LSNNKEELRPGWIVQLDGDEFDLEEWRRAFIEPFDPIAKKIPDGKTVLRCKDFEIYADASEVQARALVLVARLNGALLLANQTRPVKVAGVSKIDIDGKLHPWSYAVSIEFECQARDRITMEVIGPDGLSKATPAPGPSLPQHLNQLAELNDVASDLLDHFGRANNWYDIYKTLEFSASLVGSEHKLQVLLGVHASDAKNLKATANFYRHAKAHRPNNLVSLNEAMTILVIVVRAALSSNDTVEKS
jgi:hypothetical protein